MCACLVLTSGLSPLFAFLEEIIHVFFKYSSAVLGKWQLPDLMRRYGKQVVQGRVQTHTKSFIVYFQCTLVFFFFPILNDEVQNVLEMKTFMTGIHSFPLSNYTSSTILQYFINMSMYVFISLWISCLLKTNATFLCGFTHERQFDTFAEKIDKSKEHSLMNMPM